jgi:hypothetical protein
MEPAGATVENTSELLGDKWRSSRYAGGGGNR